MADLKRVYAAPTEETALSELESFDEKWSGKYPKIAKSWKVFKASRLFPVQTSSVPLFVFLTEPFAIDKNSFLSVAIGTVTYGVRKVIVSLPPVKVNWRLYLSRCHGIFLFGKPFFGFLHYPEKCAHRHSCAPLIVDM